MQQRVRLLAWSLSLVVSAIALLAWGNFIRWQLDSSYRLFPLFGLMAYSLMWSHYMAAAVKLHLNLDKEVLRKYFSYTSGAVLGFILLHPGLLAWQLWRDGLGLPPKSYLDNYVAPSLKWAAILGMIGLIIFLSFELHRWWGERKWWRFIQYASDAGMVLIFIHVLKLGSLMTGWFKYVWYFYGTTYAVALLYMYVFNAKASKEGIV